MAPHRFVPDLAEIDRLRRNYANLLAASRATLAAWHEGDNEALLYLIDELDAVGQLPSIDTMSPPGTAQQRLDAWLEAVPPWGAW